MTPEEFRAAGHELIDWIADYRSRIDDFPVRAQVQPGAVAASMDPEPPDRTGDIATMLAELERVVLPGMTHMQHPNNHAFFPANHSLASVLGDLASTGLGGLGISWESNPALTEVEAVICDWMRQLVGLSDAWVGTIADTASTSCLTALISARERTLDYALQAGGFQSAAQPLMIYTTDQAHSSVRKAALLAGFGADNIRVVAGDQRHAMAIDALVALIAEDIAASRRPCAVVASVGSTGVTAIDSVAEIVAATEADDVWVHVDAAMAGSAMLLPECRWMWDGVERADSVVWNPHKWMGTALDTSLYYVRDPQHLVRVMSTTPSYLRSSVDGEVTQYRDWGIPLGRRFRALKLWFHLHLDGVDAIKARLRRDLENTQWFREQVEATTGWTVVAPAPLQTVCVRHEPPGLTPAELDAHTLAWCAAVNDGGRAYLTPSILDDRWMVRVSIGVEGTEREHLETTWALMRDAAESTP